MKIGIVGNGFVGQATKLLTNTPKTEVLVYDIDPKKPMDNFDYFYDLAAYRTLVSVCDFFPDTNQNMILSLLRFDYTDILNWAINSGLDNPMTKDFLLPFEDWIYNHQNRN